MKEENCIKKIILTITSILLCIYSLVSCTGNNSDLKNEENTISNISIFESGNNIGDKLSENPVLVLENEKEIKLFLNLIGKASKMDGILDIVTPKYIAEISYLDKQETIYFSIFNEDKNYSGMFVRKGKRGVGYIFRTQDIEEFMKEYKDVFNINEDLVSDNDVANNQLKYSESPYTLEMAINNGDIVNVHGDKYNTNKLDKFIENVKLGIEDNIKIVEFTYEGDPIITTLNYNSEKIEYIFDNTRDTFGSPTVIEKSFNADDFYENDIGYFLTEERDDFLLFVK